MVPENLLLEQDRSQRDEPDVLSVRADSLLFAPGSEKQFIYWIDEGKIELHWSMQGSDSDHIEWLGSGDYFGLGFLKRHACAAIAALDSSIHQLPRSAGPALSEIDAKYRVRDAIETQREFTHQREMAVACGCQPLPQRLAAFLSLISGLNAYEGRDPMLIADDVTGFVVADYLATDVNALGPALKQLSELGAVEFAPPHGLRICDLGFLDYIANAPAAMVPVTASNISAAAPN
jgi:CRP/FNR family transcriptional regulator